jgi:phosphatidylglycerophosphate synthase
MKNTDPAVLAPQRRPQSRPPADALVHTAVPAGLAALAVSAWAWPHPGALAVTAAVSAAGAGLARRGLGTGYPHARLGACNRVTLVRGAIVACLAGATAAAALGAPPVGWLPAAMALVALVLDGVDGALARASGLESAFGARFDMETDAALALVLALLAWLGGAAGAWVLALGGLRLVFVAAAALLPWLAAPLPPRAGRKTVCVIQIAALVVLVAPWPGTPVATVTGLAALAALVWSFARDVHWLARVRFSARAGAR